MGADQYARSLFRAVGVACPALVSPVSVRLSDGSTTEGMTDMTTATATRKPSAKEQAETTKALTKAQEAALSTLVKAVSDGFVEYNKLDDDAEALTNAAYLIKVNVARAVGKLMDHPAVTATRGPSAGQPARDKVSALTGIPRTTLIPVFQAATELRKHTTKGVAWHKRTGKPGAEELAIITKYMSRASARRAELRAEAKGKGTAPAVKGKGTAVKGKGTATKVNYDSVKGALSAALELLGKFTADAGFTTEQADELGGMLDQLHDGIESATAK